MLIGWAVLCFPPLDQIIEWARLSFGQSSSFYGISLLDVRLEGIIGLDQLLPKILANWHGPVNDGPEEAGPSSDFISSFEGSDGVVTGCFCPFLIPTELLAHEDPCRHLRHNTNKVFLGAHNVPF